MSDETKTREQLLAELSALRQQYALLEATRTQQQLINALHESEKRYNHLLEHSQGLIYLHDLHGTILLVNPATARVLHYDAQTLIGKNLRDLLAPSVQHLFESYIRRMRRYGLDSGLIRVLTHYGEERVWVYRNVRYDDAGQTVHILGHAQDITERMRIEEALKRSHADLEARVQERTVALQRLNTRLQAEIAERHQIEDIVKKREALHRRIVEAVPAGIIQVDRDGRAIHTNSEALLILGLSQEMLLQSLPQDWSERVFWEDGQACAFEDFPVIRCLASGQPQPATTLGIRRPDGSLVWAVFTVIPLLEANQRQVSGAIVTFLDITARKQWEQQRQQTQKMEAIGTLAGGIAHEFNNLLAIILGYAELGMSELASTHPLGRYLQEIMKASTRARDLIQQILTFSRLENQQHVPTSLARVITEALDFLRASLPDTITLQTAIGADVGAIRADAMQIRQLFLNLCTNAEYAMRATGGRLDIALENVELDAVFASQHAPLQAGPHVQLTVRDTGSGIEPEFIERIFEPFFTTKSVGEGTGMGLAMVHGILTTHQGAITVESSPGEGTTFRLYFPRLPVRSELVVASQTEALPRGQGNILFVDDDVSLVALGQAILERLGYAVTTATTGQEALELFTARPQHFDLVIMDHFMPGMTGEALVVALRRLQPTIPLIFCTGGQQPMTPERAQNVGITALLVKPLTTRELSTTVHRVLHASPTA